MTTTITMPIEDYEALQAFKEAVVDKKVMLDTVWTSGGWQQNALFSENEFILQQQEQIKGEAERAEQLANEIGQLKRKIEFIECCLKDARGWTNQLDELPWYAFKKRRQIISWIRIELQNGIERSKKSK